MQVDRAQQQRRENRDRGEAVLALPCAGSTARPHGRCAKRAGDAGIAAALRKLTTDEQRENEKDDRKVRVQTRSRCRGPARCSARTGSSRSTRYQGRYRTRPAIGMLVRPAMTGIAKRLQHDQREIERVERKLRCEQPHRSARRTPIRSPQPIAATRSAFTPDSSARSRRSTTARICVPSGVSRNASPRPAVPRDNRG